jgi:hypothetical protein
MLTWQWLQQQLQAVLLAQQLAQTQLRVPYCWKSLDFYRLSKAVWVGAGCAPSSDHCVLLMLYCRSARHHSH